MARSGEMILDSLFNNAIMRELIPSRLPKTRIGLLYAGIAGEMENWEQVLDNVASESFLTEAKQIVNVEKLAEPTYLRAKERPSEVILEFRWSEAARQSPGIKVDTKIPFGQIVQSNDVYAIEYMVVEEGTLYANAQLVHLRARSVEKGAFTMVPADTLDSFMSTDIREIEVTNPEASWGGRDVEGIENTRQNAMSARYSMPRGTRDHINIMLANLGLDQQQYNIVDNLYAYGSFSIFIDTIIDEQILEVREAMLDAKAKGIYSTTEMALPIQLELGFDINVVNQHNITPEERDNLRRDVNNGVQTFIMNNGVGKDIIMSQLTYYLFEQYLKKYKFYDVTISPTETTTLNTKGNISIRYNEVVKIINLAVSIKTG